MTISRSTNIILQILGIAGSVGAVVIPNLPEEQKAIAVSVLTIIQGVTALIAHQSNPDGTPATVAFTKEKK